MSNLLEHSGYGTAPQESGEQIVASHIVIFDCACGWSVVQQTGPRNYFHFSDFKRETLTLLSHECFDLVNITDA